MKLRFICATHQQELKLNMDKTLQFCQSGFDTGQFYKDHLQWKEAIPHLGCAFEAAEILLSYNAIDTKVSCDWLAKSALLLAQSFNNLGYQNQAEDIIWMAINRLEEQLVLDRNQRIWMEQYLTALYARLKVYIIKAAKAQGPDVNSQKVLSLMH